MTTIHPHDRLAAAGITTWARSGLLFLLLGGCWARAAEFRGWWVDTFHPAVRNAAEIAQLVAEARLARFNAVIVEVRKRGDAYYDSRFEPKASDVDAGFDPLAELVRQAHSTTLGPRLEVHAWIVTYNIWNNRTTPPPQTNHPYRLHPDWLTQSFEGATWDGHNYAFDPGHPAVQEHTYNVAMDIVARYDVDGLHFDYIRYAGREWGYNPAAVARFNAASGSSGKPALDDSAWLEWRRSQVTGLVRRVGLSAFAVKPALKISAATITWTPSGTTYAQWLGSAAYSDVLQDWRGWMEEGLLDLNIPMAYFRQEQNAADWTQWSRFAKEHRYGRHLALGPGTYLNTISNSIVQIRSTRTPTATAPGAEGVSCYSYAVPAKDGVSRTEFTRALTQRTAYDTNTMPVFAVADTAPPMPWKTTSGPSALLGYVRDARTGQGIAGAQVELCTSPPGRLVTDANGFFGLRNATAGVAWVASSVPGFSNVLHAVDLVPGQASRVEFLLKPADAALVPMDVSVSPGTSSAWISWRTETPTEGQVIFGLGGAWGASGGIASDGRRATNHAVFLGDLRPGPAPDPGEYGLRIVTWNERGTNGSELHTLRPAWPVVRDETSARYTGSWTYVTNTPSVERAYRRASVTSSASPTAVLVWSLPIQTPGLYDVSVVYPAGVSGSTAAPFEIESRAGKRIVTLNQSSGGGAYRTLATGVRYLRGDTAIVRLRNNTSGAAGSYVLADAIRWTFQAGQDPPPTGQVPEWWSSHFFGQPVGPDEDPDADGYSNAAEFVLATVPTSLTGRFEVWPDAPATGTGRVVFQPYRAGRVYRLEARDDWETAAWTLVADAALSGVPPEGAVFRDPFPASTRRFYRVVAALEP